MLTLAAEQSSLSTPVTVALIAIVVVQVALAVYCIIDIVRRPAVLGGHKWVWIVIVALFNLVGSIVYLAVGRTQTEAAEHEAPAVTHDKAASAADVLYGPHSREEDSSPPGPPVP